MEHYQRDRCANVVMWCVCKQKVNFDLTEAANLGDIFGFR